MYFENQQTMNPPIQVSPSPGPMQIIFQPQYNEEYMAQLSNAFRSQFIQNAQSPFRPVYPLNPQSPYTSWNPADFNLDYFYTNRKQN